MKTAILSSALMLAASTLVLAQDARYVTVTVPSGTTNQIQIADFEVGELVMWEVGGVSALIQKDAVSMPAYTYHNGHGLIVQGPASFSFWIPNNQSFNELATVRITPASFPPDKTLIIP